MAILSDGAADSGGQSCDSEERRLRRAFMNARDGISLAFYEMGPQGGRPVVLVHGHTLSAASNWIEPGCVEMLAGLGCRVVAPDLRAHGASGAPHDASAYRRGALAEDLIDLVTHLGLREGEYDLVGYSIGSRVVVTAMTVPDGLRPRRAVLGGMGLEGLVAAEGRGWPIRRVLAYPYATFPPGSFEAEVRAVLPEGTDLVAQGFIPETNVNIPLRSIIGIGVPVLVVMGDADNECVDAFKLSQILSRGQYVEVPGRHMHAFQSHRFTQAVAAFLESDLG